MTGRRLAGLLLSLAVVSGCDTSNYAFKIDTSIKIVKPTARAEVELPVVLAWTDSRPPGNPRVAPADPTAEYYAVFIDRSPIGPGKRLASLVEDPDSCEVTQGCPQPTLLTDMHVFLAAEPELRLEFLADLRPTKRGGTKDAHEMTIVRMRGDKRAGETSYRQTFFVAR